VAKHSKAKWPMVEKVHWRWAGVALFAAGWMFVLGILVGRGTAPVNLETDKLEKELSELKAAMTRKEQAVIQSQTSDRDDGKTQLGFYEALKAPEKPGPHKARTPSNPTPKPPPKPSRPKAPPASKPVRSKEATPVPPAKQEGDRAAASSAAKPDRDKPSAGRFTIQVAAVRETGSAKRLVTRLRSKGFPAYQIRVDVPGKGAWHRVRVGAYENRDAAERMLAKLKTGRIDGMVVSTK
jgi:cell division septation protein DedD